METMRKILLGTDFSASGKHAQQYAFALAKRSGAELHIAHAVDTAYPTYAGVYGFGVPVDLHIEEVRRHAKERLEEVVEEAAAAGISAQPHLLDGRSAEEVVELARQLECNLIVVATHGRSGFDHFVFGSTCERIVRYATTPVLTVKSHEKEFVDVDGEIHINRILCPCDLSETSEEAVPLAAGMCTIFDAELVLMHVVDSRVEYPLLMPEAQPPTAAELRTLAAERLDALAKSVPHVRSKVEIVSGVAHLEIGSSAQEDDIDLVVMTTHGRRGLPLALLGSTAEKVVRSARVPVLTARPVQQVKGKDHAKMRVSNPQPATS